MPLAEAKFYYATENRITSLSLMLDDADNISETVTELKKSLSDQYEIMPWQEMNTELVSNSKRQYRRNYYVGNSLYCYWIWSFRYNNDDDNGT